MGANKTQATAVALFLLAFTFLAAGLFIGGNILLLLIFVAMLLSSVFLFAKAKPWEHKE